MEYRRIRLPKSHPLYVAFMQLRNEEDVHKKHKILNKILKLSSGREIEITYTDVTSNSKYVFYLNRNSFEYMRNLLINMQEGINNDDIADYSKNLLLMPIKNLKIYLYRRKRNKHGGYFPYINNSKYNLKRYQIYKTISNRNNENCLVYALRKLGHDVDGIKLLIPDNYHVSLSDLPIISHKLAVNILLYSYGKNHELYKKIYPKKNPYDDSIHIALYHNHYFIYEETDVNHLTSLALVRHLFENGYFEYHGIITKKPSEKNDIDLRKIMGEQAPFEFSDNYKDKKVNICFADIECKIRPYHKPYLYAYYYRDKYQVFSENDNIPWSGFRKFLDSFPCGYNIVYFHNMKYDWYTIKKCPYINVKNILKKDNIYYLVVFTYYKKTFELRDSYKLIPKKLADFPRAFDIPNLIKNEYILYELYNDENTTHPKRDYVYYKIYEGEDYKYAYTSHDEGYTRNLDGLTMDNNEYILIDNSIVVDKKIIDKCPNFYVKGKYYHIAHYRYYLHLDCLILKKGVERYRDLMIKLIDIDCYHNLTLPSMIHKRVCLNGYYEGVYELSDNLRIFVTKALHGGRVCTKDNSMWDVRGRIYNIDGRSLYPSAIKRICEEGGFPTGKARVIRKWPDIETYTYYVVKIRITYIGKCQQIPFLSYLEDGSRNYTNDMIDKEVVVDKITLEDWVNFHAIKYEFIEGVYWRGAGKTDMGAFIEYLYSSRQQYINDNNVAMNEITKLTLNSLYGKTIIKPYDTKLVVRRNDKANQYIAENYEKLISQEKCANQSVFTINKLQIGHSNLVHVGGMILSMARRIMNEPMNLANDLGIHVLYTDTDSMHIVDSLDNDLTYQDGLQRLCQAYYHEYGRNLLGRDLGQFAIEFKFPNHTDIHSRRTLILGKKVYLHVVNGLSEDGEYEHYYLPRMKGVNSYAMDEHKDVLILYERMFAGEKIAFNLAYGDSVMFDFKDVVTSKESHIVKLKFDGIRNIL